MNFQQIPPPKTNMEPENDGLEIGISSSRGSFSGSRLVFGGVFSWVSIQVLEDDPTE